MAARGGQITQGVEIRRVMPVSRLAQGRYVMFRCGVCNDYVTRTHSDDDIGVYRLSLYLNAVWSLELHYRSDMAEEITSPDRAGREVGSVSYRLPMFWNEVDIL